MLQLQDLLKVKCYVHFNKASTVEALHQPTNEPNKQTHKLANTTASAKANVETNFKFVYCMQVQIYECTFTEAVKACSGKPSENKYFLRALCGWDCLFRFENLYFTYFLLHWA